MRRALPFTAPIDPPYPGWRTLAWRRVLRLGWLKALGNTLFLWGFFVLYLYTQHHPQAAVTQIPATALDDWIGFQAWALWLYLSLWVYTALPVALQPTFWTLARYGLWTGSLCALALAVFWWWPTSVSQAVGQRPGASGMLAVLYAVDTNGNALPSLHVAGAVFSAVVLATQLRAIAAPRWTHGLSVLWCAGIVYSTLAIKQHLLWDVLAGAALGVTLAALPWAWRSAVGAGYKRASRTASPLQ